MRLIGQILETKSISKHNEVGEFEISFLSGDYDNSTVEDFLNVASNIKSIKDYAYLKSVILFSKLGNENRAEELLYKVRGKFKEFSDNLRYDMGYETGKREIDIEKYILKGNLRSIWNYRKIIISDSDNKTDDIIKYQEKYPKSALNQLLDNWY